MDLIAIFNVGALLHRVDITTAGWTDEFLDEEGVYAACNELRNVCHSISTVLDDLLSEDDDDGPESDSASGSVRCDILITMLGLTACALPCRITQRLPLKRHTASRTNVQHTFWSVRNKRPLWHSNSRPSWRTDATYLDRLQRTRASSDCSGDIPPFRHILGSVFLDTMDRVLYPWDALGRFAYLIFWQ